MSAWVPSVRAGQVFSPKGWESSAQGKSRSDAALGSCWVMASSPKGWDRGVVAALRAARLFAWRSQGGGPSALALG